MTTGVFHKNILIINLEDLYLHWWHNDQGGCNPKPEELWFGALTSQLDQWPNEEQRVVNPLKSLSLTNYNKTPGYILSHSLNRLLILLLLYYNDNYYYWYIIIITIIIPVFYIIVDKPTMGVISVGLCKVNQMALRRWRVLLATAFTRQTYWANAWCLCVYCKAIHTASPEWVWEALATAIINAYSVLISPHQKKNAWQKKKKIHITFLETLSFIALGRVKAATQPRRLSSVSLSIVQSEIYNETVMAWTGRNSSHRALELFDG